MARNSLRSLQSIRESGNPLQFGGTTKTITVSKVSSITLYAPTPDSLVTMSQDTFQQLQKQNAVGIITSKGRQTVTISFFVKTQTLQNKLSGSNFLQSSSLTQSGSGSVSTSGLTTTTVTLNSGSVNVFPKLKSLGH